MAPYIPVRKDVLEYVQRYGGRCRDCGDDGPICLNSGLPCGDSEKAIRHVLAAINYGVTHGFLKFGKNPDQQSAPAADDFLEPGPVSSGLAKRARDDWD